MKFELGSVVIELDHITTVKKFRSDFVTITFYSGEKLNVYCHKTPEQVAPGAATFQGSADDLIKKIQ